MKTYRFKLYVAGRSARAERAIRNLRELCEQHLEGDAEYEVVDVLSDPQLAEERRVLSTPTLDKVAPAPSRRVIGDLSDPAKLIPALALYLDADSDKPMKGTT